MQEHNAELDENELLDQVSAELLQAIETKDKALLVDSLAALIAYIQQEDEKQDAQE